MGVTTYKHVTWANHFISLLLSTFLCKKGEIIVFEYKMKMSYKALSTGPGTQHIFSTFYLFIYLFIYFLPLLLLQLQQFLNLLW